MAHADASGPAEACGQLTVSDSTTQDGARVVSVAGELDLDGEMALGPALFSALRADPPPRLVVLDLSGLTFCDSSGLNLLLRVRLEAEHRSITLRLVCPGATVLRLLKITGMDTLFDIHDRLEQALA
ncbi:STAS domain-containing protein [Streptomyces sp. NPDC100445]|uniref:STAS domain-containing protein n=1 Tax=Streptomyces sp. NPDC100445 TaxID=3366102 RepID=UPI00381D4550